MLLILKYLSASFQHFFWASGCWIRLLCLQSATFHWCICLCEIQHRILDRKNFQVILLFLLPTTLLPFVLCNFGNDWVKGFPLKISIWFQYFDIFLIIIFSTINRRPWKLQACKKMLFLIKVCCRSFSAHNKISDVCCCVVSFLTFRLCVWS